MKTVKASPEPRQLRPMELVAMGLFLVGLRIVSGQLSALLLEQVTAHPTHWVSNEQMDRWYLS